MTGWREKRREARWKRKARMRNLERINKNKKCLAAKIIWICSRLPWRRELKWQRKKRQHESMSCRLPWRRELKSDGQKWLNSNYGVAFREGVSWNSSEMVAPLFSTGRLPWRRELKWLHAKIPISRRTSPSVKAWVEMRNLTSSPESKKCRLPWRRELKFSSSKISSSIALRRLPWRRELKSRTAIQRSCLIRRLPWRRELRILAFRPYKCAVIERL